MVDLNVSIEIKGKQVNVGSIYGTNYEDACFRYSTEYIEDNESKAISMSLPVRKGSFTPEETRSFFEGLLPEGYTRKTLSECMSIGEEDYTGLLAVLGKECLGAIRIYGDDELIVSSYEKLTLEDVSELAGEGVTKSVDLVTRSRMSLTGASGKAGLYYDKKNDTWYLPTGYAASTHIVKQSHVRLGGIVTNEQLIMMTAGKLGLDIAKSFIINTGSGDDSDVLFATERYDRRFCDSCVYVSGLKCPERLHQEDFGQALGISASDKYESDITDRYLKRMFDLLKDYSSDPIRDRMELWSRVVFNVLAGNTDCHVKNFALIYGDDLKTVRLAPAYDMLSTVIYSSLPGKMAFSIGGEYDIEKISGAEMMRAAEEIGLGRSVAMEKYRELSEKFDPMLDKTACELYEMGFEKAKDIKDEILRKRQV